MKPYFETENGKLYCNNCENIMPKINNNSIDLILTDLPYGTTACKWDSIIPFDFLWEQSKRLIKENGVVILTGSEPFSSKLRLSNLDWYKYDWVWNKVHGSNFLNSKNRPLKTHENVLVFSPTANFTFNPIRVKRSQLSLKRHPAGKKVDIKRGNTIAEHYGTDVSGDLHLAKDGKKHPIDIIKFSIWEKGRYKFRHPTKKPLALMEYMVKTYTNKKYMVLDFTVGSGTTAVACEKLNRHWIGIDKNKEYCETAKQRIKQEADQEKLF